MVQKLAILILIPCVVILGLTFLSSNWMKLLSGQLIHVLSDQTYQVTQLILNADRDLYQSQEGIYLLSNPALDAEGKGNAVKAYSDNLQQVKDRVGQAMTIMEKDKASFEIYKHKTSLKNPFELYADFQTELGKWEKSFDKASMSVTDKAVYDSSFSNAREDINMITEVIDDYAIAETAHWRTETSKTTSTLWIVGILSIVVTGLIGFFIAMDLRKRTNSIVKLLNTTAQLDFTDDFSKVPMYMGKDEMAQIATAENKARSEFKSVVVSVTDNTVLVHEAMDNTKTKVVHLYDILTLNQ